MGGSTEQKSLSGSLSDNVDELKKKNSKKSVTRLPRNMGGPTNPRPGLGQYRAGFSNNGGSPKPRKRAPFQKKIAECVGIDKDVILCSASQ